MPIKTSMGAHKLEVRKGDRNSIIDLTAPLLNTADNLAAAVAGRCVTLNPNTGKLEAGLALGRLVFFAWSGTDVNNYPDVQRDRGMPYAGEARFGTISVHAAVELSTTEFVDDANLKPGALLTALSTAAVTADRGKLKLAAAGNVVVGLVAPAGKHVSPDGYDTLAFYPHLITGTTVVDA